MLNGKQSVADEYRVAVLREAQALGYSANRAARALASRRADCVGLILPEPAEMLSGNAYFPRLVAAIGTEMGRRGIQLAVFMPEVGESQDRLAAYAAAGHVDGMIVVAYDARDALLESLSGQGVPVVAVGRPLGATGISYVDCDHALGSRQAVDHLIGVGCRRIATIAGSQDSADGVDRLRGFHAAMQAHGLPVGRGQVAYGDYDFGSGQRGVAALLAADPSIDGLYVAGELMAFGALAGLQAAGRTVPADVAVVSFDDSPPSAGTVPPLTSIRQPIEEMGVALTTTLLDHIAGDSGPRSMVLSTTLVVRESTLRVR